MRYPKKIEILGQPIRIVIDENLADNGAYYHDDNLIKLREQNLELMARSLMHEIAHALFAHAGWSEILGDKKEEALCQLLENLSTLYALKPSGKNTTWGRKIS